jgi:hypothetical protein
MNHQRYAGALVYTSALHNYNDDIDRRYKIRESGPLHTTPPVLDLGCYGSDECAVLSGLPMCVVSFYLSQAELVAKVGSKTVVSNQLCAELK